MSSDVVPAAVVLRLEEVVLPEAFVVETLHAYAHDHLPRWLGEHYDEPAVRLMVQGLVRSDEVAGCGAGEGVPLPEDAPWEKVRDAVLERLHLLLHQEELSAEAESLRESIWLDGCRRGQIRAEVYDDVLRGLARWHAAGLAVAVFSPTSAHAQKELCGRTEEGDLTPLVAAWFDARAGSPTQAAAYKSIAESLGVDPVRIMYVTNRPGEADAAVAAGLQALLVDRMGCAIPKGHAHRIETDLEVL